MVEHPPLVKWHPLATVCNQDSIVAAALVDAAPVCRLAICTHRCRYLNLFLPLYYNLDSIQARCLMLPRQK